MIRRLTLCAIVALAFVNPWPANAQFANKTGNVVGTIGAACISSANDYGWPDTNGNILKCVSNVWTLQGVAASAAGSTGYVQFNNGGALAGSSNLFWNSSSGALGIGTTAPATLLHLNTTGAPATIRLNTYSNNWYTEITNNSYTAGDTYINNVANGAAAGHIYFEFGSSNPTVTMQANGNVGIGTTAPQSTMQVVSSSTNGFRAGDGTRYVALGANSNAVWIGNDGTVPMSLGAGNGAMAIEQSTGIVLGKAYPWTDPGAGNVTIPSGSVGIGTTAPYGPLDVNGAIVSRGSGAIYHYTDVYNAYPVNGTGTLKIAIPAAVSQGHDFVQIVIRGYDQTSTTAEWQVIVGTFYCCGAASYPSATITGRAPFSRVAVGYDGTHDYILIGNTSTSWNSDPVEVVDVYVTGSYATLYANSAWTTGWTTTLLSSESGLTPSNTSIDIFDSSGNIGIATLAAATSNTLCYNTSIISGFNAFATCSSLRKYKTDIAPLANALDEVATLKPISYTSTTSHRREIGFIAEDVEQVDPRLSTYDKDGKLVGVQYDHVTALLLAGMKQLKADNDDLHREVAELKRRLAQ